MMEVALDGADEDAGIITESVGCMSECTTKKRLAYVEQVEADVGSVALLKDLLDEADFAFSVSRTERN